MKFIAAAAAGSKPGCKLPLRPISLFFLLSSFTYEAVILERKVQNSIFILIAKGGTNVKRCAI